jgi:GINS complex subunit 4
MVEGPDIEGAVFGRGLGPRDGVDEDDEDHEGNISFRVRGRDADGVANVARGEVVVSRWADVKDAVERGEMELV